jgi:DNA end-binding protein Ku
MKKLSALIAALFAAASINVFAQTTAAPAKKAEEKKAAEAPKAAAKAEEKKAAEPPKAAAKADGKKKAEEKKADAAKK